MQRVNACSSDAFIIIHSLETNTANPDQTAPRSLIWVRIVCKIRRLYKYMYIRRRERKGSAVARW